MTEMPAEEMYKMLEYLATSVPHDKEDYEVEAKALLDLMGTYYTSMGFPIILREMVRQNIAQDYEQRIKSFRGGTTKCANDELKEFGEKFNEAFLDTMAQHWEEIEV
tara:strand:+ start:162 stop:482 length:321 start_codon:yes stop_codon:yes gene_type:complete